MKKIKINDNLLIIVLLLLSIFLVNIAKAKIFRIAIIDTGYTQLGDIGVNLCESGHYDFVTNKPIAAKDASKSKHGSQIAQILSVRSKSKNICFLFYRVSKTGDLIPESKLISAFRLAIKNKARIINYSIISNRHNWTLKKVIRRANLRGIKIFVGVGNSNKNLNNKCNVYPSCFGNRSKNLILVGALDEDGDVAKYSNYGARISVYKYGKTQFGDRGTSFAVPRAAGDYVRSLRVDR